MSRLSHGTSRRRAVSNLLATLIIIAIVVGVAISVALMIGGFTQKTKPKGGDLAVLSARVVKLSDTDYTVEVTVQIVGGEPIRVSYVSVTYGGNTYNLTDVTPRPTEYFDPNTIVKIKGDLLGVSLQTYSNIVINVNYCTLSGKCTSTSFAAKVEPVS